MKFAFETLPFDRNAGDQVLDGLPLDSEELFGALDRVIAARESSDDRRQVREGPPRQFAGINDDSEAGGGPAGIGGTPGGQKKSD